MELERFDLLIKVMKDGKAKGKPVEMNEAINSLAEEIGLDRNFRYDHREMVHLFECENRRRWAKHLGIVPGTVVAHPRGALVRTVVSRVDEEGYVILRGVRGRHDARKLTVLVEAAHENTRP